MKNFQPPKGTRDIYYEEAAIRRKVITGLQRCFLQFGFCDFDTPSFEHLETLEQKSGSEVAEQIYAFEDKAGRKLGLRFEFTASLGRAIASQPTLLRPFKRYQIGNVWRYERPQANRYREFYQADVDIIGPRSMDCEVEILLAVGYALESFGVKDYVFQLNNRKTLRAQLEVADVRSEQLQAAVLRGLDKLEKIDHERVREYVLREGVTADQYGRFTGLVPDQASNDSILEQLESNLASSDLGREGNRELREILEMSAETYLKGRIQLTPHLVRGLDYYTGPVFEVRSPALGNVSFGGGGRYDGMVELYGGTPAGAVGFAFGVERLISVLQQRKLLNVRKSEAQIMIAPLTPEYAKEAFKLANELRAGGVRVFQHLGTAKLGKQFSYASKMGFPFVVVVGETELASNVFKLKNMSSGEEMEVERSKLLPRLRQEFADDDP